MYRQGHSKHFVISQLIYSSFSLSLSVSTKSNTSPKRREDQIQSEDHFFALTQSCFSHSPSQSLVPSVGALVPRLFRNKKFICCPLYIEWHFHPQALKDEFLSIVLKINILPLWSTCGYTVPLKFRFKSFLLYSSAEILIKLHQPHPTLLWVMPTQS